MEDYLQANQKRWDQLTTEHENSAFYDLVGFRAGKDRLRSIELSELGDVVEKPSCIFNVTSAWIPLPGRGVGR